jgi:hypothetical protein
VVEPELTGQRRRQTSRHGSVETRHRRSAFRRGGRWLVSGGLTGSTEADGFAIEPSARVHALWEQQNAYTYSQGPPQAERSFLTGRASTGVAIACPLAVHDALTISPYADIYADYYFAGDNAAAVTLAGGGGLTSTPFFDGWSAREASLAEGVGFEPTVPLQARTCRPLTF